MSGPSVLEYARHHGLASDHTSENILDHLHRLPPTPAESDAEGDGRLPDLVPPDIAVDLQEPKLQLSRTGALLLAESIRKPDPAIPWDTMLPDPRRVQKMKMEEPLLASDHDTDVAAFKREAAQGMNTTRLVQFCTSTTDVSADYCDNVWDGIESGRYLKEVEEILNAEKVHITKETILDLADALKDTVTQADVDESMKMDILALKVISTIPFANAH